MRDIRSGNCPLCDHHEIVAAYPPDWGMNDTDHPSAVTADPRLIFAGRTPGRTYGRLRLYFCRSCGFSQTFVELPDRVPVGEKYKTALIEGTQREGYR